MTLDAATEQRIQQEFARGRYREPADVIADRSGREHSFRVEERLFAAFDQLGLTPGIGHLRSNLILRELYFHYVEPYLILYRRDTLPIVILAIVHGARDITTLAEGGSF